MIGEGLKGLEDPSACCTGGRVEYQRGGEVPQARTDGTDTLEVFTIQIVCNLSEELMRECR